MIIEKYILHLTCILSINLIYQSSVTNCESSFRKRVAIGTKSYGKENLENAKLLRAKKDANNTSSEETSNSTSHAIEETTIAIDVKDLINENENSTTDAIEGNSTADRTSLTINETYITTPLFSSNVTTDDSLVPIIDETPDYINGTESDSEESLSSDSTPPITTTQTIPNPTITTVMPYSETPTTLTHTSNQSPIFSTTESTTVTTIKNNEDLPQCSFESKIDCQNFQITCYGWGEIDCGSRKTRSLNDSNFFEQNSDLEVYKLSLERISQSETIRNTECVLTPFENQYFSCKPQPKMNECTGRSFCKQIEKSSELNGPMELWKVGLIAALTATGGTIFIIVAVVAYISYNKLKVRPELSMNGYHNNPQNVTRV